MQTVTHVLPLEKSESELLSSFPENALFFDIETTGFSPSSCTVYLIGAAYCREGVLQTVQYFAETPAQEVELLLAFSSLLSGFGCLYTFNGTGFDLPFLKARYKHFSLPDPTGNCVVEDIFKETSRLKSLLRLPNYRQKTVERFLGSSREDRFDGGELIGVYKEFVKAPDPEALNLLLLHNYEDVIGMTRLLGLYRYRKALNGPIRIRESLICTYEQADGSEGLELQLALGFPCAVPVPVSLTCGESYLTISGDHGQMRIPIFRGELHYFYPNYKDYYYLPLEDQAIHKDVASFVDKEHRQKCHACNCYTRKNGLFLPQQEECFSPFFRHEYKDPESYFEIARDMFEADQEGRYPFLEKYAARQIDWMFSAR